MAVTDPLAQTAGWFVMVGVAAGLAVLGYRRFWPPTEPPRRSVSGLRAEDGATAEEMGYQAHRHW